MTMAPVLLLAVLVAALAVADAVPKVESKNKCPPDIKPVKAGAAAAGKSAYTTKYDNIDVKMIMHNDRLLKNYIDCLMERKPCSREGQLLKEIIPDALQTECSRCSEKQKQIAGEIMSYLLQYKKAYWEELLCKYDPEGRFREQYEYDEDDEDNE
nr:chemosensory protein [Odontothrips loti]